MEKKIKNGISEKEHQWTLWFQSLRNGVSGKMVLGRVNWGFVKCIESVQRGGRQQNGQRRFWVHLRAIRKRSKSIVKEVARVTSAVESTMPNRMLSRRRRKIVRGAYETWALPRLEETQDTKKKEK